MLGNGRETKRVWTTGLGFAGQALLIGGIAGRAVDLAEGAAGGELGDVAGSNRLGLRSLPIRGWNRVR